MEPGSGVFKDPGGIARISASPPTFHNNEHTASAILATGVPGSRAARRVSARSRIEITSPMLNPIRLPATYGPTAPADSISRNASFFQHNPGRRLFARIGRRTRISAYERGSRRLDGETPPSHKSLRRWEEP